MRIIASPCKGRDLKPGDLFSTVGPSYWDHFHENRSIGERVYIRTETPCENAPDADAPVFRVTIDTSGGHNGR